MRWCNDNIGFWVSDYSAGVLAIDGNVVFDATNHTGDLFTESRLAERTLSVGGDGNVSANIIILQVRLHLITHLYFG